MRRQDIKKRRKRTRREGGSAEVMAGGRAGGRGGLARELREEARTDCGSFDRLLPEALCLLEIMEGILEYVISNQRLEALVLDSLCL